MKYTCLFVFVFRHQQHTSFGYSSRDNCYNQNPSFPFLRLSCKRIAIYVLYIDNSFAIAAHENTRLRALQVGQVNIVWNLTHKVKVIFERTNSQFIRQIRKTLFTCASAGISIPSHFMSVAELNSSLIAKQKTNLQLNGELKWTDWIWLLFNRDGESSW